MILSSPVDGPASQGYVITDGTTLNFAMPTIVLPAGLDNVPESQAAGIPCAPEEISNLHFYDALDETSPRWLVNATEYGHGDYMDQGYLDLIINLHFCASKTDGTLDDFVLYRNFFSGQVVSFLKSK
ncbi:UNVERIFIED_CONTAM: hypothetical protein GTU68_020998 [Idotea baltica]|nr:hypothetical protein [Idotea baltica]